ncbi:unnamed protein product [Lampetra planeri]
MPLLLVAPHRSAGVGRERCTDSARPTSSLKDENARRSLRAVFSAIDAIVSPFYRHPAPFGQIRQIDFEPKAAALAAALSAVQRWLITRSSRLARATRHAGRLGPENEHLALWRRCRAIRRREAAGHGAGNRPASCAGSASRALAQHFGGAMFLKGTPSMMAPRGLVGGGGACGQSGGFGAPGVPVRGLHLWLYMYRYEAVRPDLACRTDGKIRLSLSRRPCGQREESGGDATGHREILASESGAVERASERGIRTAAPLSTRRRSRSGSSSARSQQQRPALAPRLGLPEVTAKPSGWHAEPGQGRQIRQMTVPRTIVTDLLTRFGIVTRTV